MPSKLSMIRAESLGKPFPNPASDHCVASSFDCTRMRDHRGVSGSNFYGSKQEWNASGVIDLCSILHPVPGKGLNWVFVTARTMTLETLFSLFPIYRRLPKLDVAGSTPVSRSIFSTTWETTLIRRYSVYSVKPTLLQQACFPGVVFEAQLPRVF